MSELDTTASLGIVFLACGYLILLAASAETVGWAVPFIVIGILFNPFKKFYLGRDAWVVADVIVIPVFILGAIFISRAFRRLGK